MRTDSLVTARMNPTASAPRPTSWAPTTGAPSGRAEMSETGLAFALRGAAEGDPPGAGDGGVSGGNRPEALPPRLNLVPPVPFRFGKLPIETGNVDVVGVGVAEDWPDAVTRTVTDTFGSLTRLDALAVAVSRTDVTEDALAATDTPA